MGRTHTILLSMALLLAAILIGCDSGGENGASAAGTLTYGDTDYSLNKAADYVDTSNATEDIHQLLIAPEGASFGSTPQESSGVDNAVILRIYTAPGEDLSAGTRTLDTDDSRSLDEYEGDIASAESVTNQGVEELTSGTLTINSVTPGESINLEVTGATTGQGVSVNVTYDGSYREM